MKFEVSQRTIRDLGNLKGRWLLRGNDVHIIKDFQYIVEKPEPESELENTSVFKRKKFKKKIDAFDKFYLTSFKVEGYNTDLKFVGTYNEDYCERLIEAHDSPYATLDLFDLAGKWEHLNDQIIALREYEADLKQDREETELREVIDLLLAEKVMNAIKKYKEITGASLADSRDYVRKVMQPKYCEV